jgi:hypothetical protein
MMRQALAPLIQQQSPQTPPQSPALGEDPLDILARVLAI